MAALLTEAQVQRLSVDERMRLIELIWSSFTPEEWQVPEWHKEIIDQRLKRMEEQPHPGIPWTEAREMLRKRREANAHRKS